MCTVYVYVWTNQVKIRIEITCTMCVFKLVCVHMYVSTYIMYVTVHMCVSDVDDVHVQCVCVLIMGTSLREMMHSHYMCVCSLCTICESGCVYV